jgi:hypothetical protein
MIESTPQGELAPADQPATESSGDPALDFLLKREDDAEQAA